MFQYYCDHNHFESTCDTQLNKTNSSVVVTNFYVVYYTVLRPEFVTRPSPQSVDLTQIATFTCSATGYNVQYEWRIRLGSFPDKVTGINTNTLVIPDVRSSDDNTYSCIVRNEAGSRGEIGGRSAPRLTVTGMTMIMLVVSSMNVVLMIQAYQR